MDVRTTDDQINPPQSSGNPILSPTSGFHLILDLTTGTISNSDSPPIPSILYNPYLTNVEYQASPSTGHFEFSDLS